MALAASTVLSFACIGQIRSGTSVVQSSISTSPQAHCHANLLHPNEDVRKACHHDYFGKPRSQQFPEHLSCGDNPYRYLRATVLGQPLYGEHAIGFRAAYPEVRRLELADLLGGCTHVIHVVRNPVACLISQKQAEATHIWSSPRASMAGVGNNGRIPAPVRLDPEEVTAFVREHEAAARYVRGSCRQACDISYESLFLSYRTTMRRLFAMLDIPFDHAVYPGTVRLRNRPFAERLSNRQELLASVPTDIKPYLSLDALI
jgi:hypothetical protein